MGVLGQVRPNQTRYLADVWNAAKCEKVMLGYWRRYCPKALASGDYETLARVHNGGEHGASRESTLRYWKKVKMKLGQQAGRKGGL